MDDNDLLERLNKSGLFTLDQIKFVIEEEANGDPDYVIWHLERLAGLK